LKNLKLVSWYLVISLLIMCFFCNVIAAQEFPSRPITIIVPTATGGGTDRAARLLQPYLQKVLGEPVLIVNQPGGAQLIGMGAMVNATPDGYTILYTDFPNTGFGALYYEDSPYEWDDMTPIVVEMIDPRIFLVNPDSEFNNMKEIIEAAKEREISVSGQTRAGPHWLTLWINNKLGTHFNFVGYPGGGPSAVALLGGHVDATFGDVYSRLNVREQVKGLGILWNERTPLWPGVKTFSEQGIEGIEELPTLARFASYWCRKELKEEYPEIFNTLVEAILKAKDDPEYQEKVKETQIDQIQVWWGPEKAKIELDKEYNKLLDYPDMF